MSCTPLGLSQSVDSLTASGLWKRSMLAALPAEIWQVITEQFLASSIVRLYLTGDRYLIRNMAHRGGVMSFRYLSSDKTRRVGWFSILSEFRGLKTFSYDTSLLMTSSAYYPIKTDLLQIPPSVTFLRLACNGSENAFWADERPSTFSDGIVSQSHLDIASHWPNLSTLILKQYSGFKQPMKPLGSAISTLPKDLLLLSIKPSALDSNSFQHLPTELKYYEQNVCLAGSSFANLPRTLEEINFNAVPGSESPQDFQFEDLPRSLTAITLLKVSTIPPAVINYLPADLTYLDLGIHLNHSQIPLICEKLRKLQFLVRSSN